MAAAHLRIAGRVQGVGFRASLAEQATRRGLVGWVRNRRDGTVEALLVGEASRLEEVVEWAWRGPRAANVTGVQVKTPAEPEAGAVKVFEQRPTE